MEEWQTEREKEWDLFKVGNEERWRENVRLGEKRDARLEAGEKYMQMLTPQVEALWRVHEAWAQSIMIGPREWMATWDELVKQRPPTPAPLKSTPAPPAPMPKIRPLPSAQTSQEEAEE
jgi:hypothetical protein